MSAAHYDPFWLGPDARRLYAALHSTGADAVTGAVCVPPLLHEQPRSRRFITEAAAELASAGVPCLRFDFFGTGDSDGPGEAMDFARMAEDIDTAVAELQARTQVERVAVVAWRGAALVVAHWLAHGGHADAIVLWEPVTDGAQWLDELVRLDAAERRVRPRPRPGVPRTSSADDGQLMGFAASARFRTELGAARLVAAKVTRRPTWLVTRETRPADMDNAIQTLTLPDAAPTFGGMAQMESALFLSPPVRAVVTELGRRLAERVPA